MEWTKQRLARHLLYWLLLLTSCLAPLNHSCLVAQETAGDAVAAETVTRDDTAGDQVADDSADDDSTDDSATAIENAAAPVVAERNEAPARALAGVAEKRGPRRVTMIEFDGQIDSLSEQYLYRKLDVAEADKPDVLIIKITSPGGEVDATLNMAKRLRDIRWAHTIAYVPEQALSGGAILSLGCDEILVGPNALFGDAGPIFMADDFLFRHASEKFRSHLVEEVRGLASAKHRPPSIAEAMVDMSVVVYEVTSLSTGQRALMTQQEIDASANPDDWRKDNPVFESRDGHFLEVRGQRVVDVKVAQAVVANEAALKARFEPIESWEELHWSRFDTTILILNTGWATALLLIAGLIAIYVEMASPGLGLGGILALVCFGLFFWSRFLGGTAEWLEVVLFLSGVLLLMVEIFVIPGFGIWGAAGLALIFTSLVLACQTFLIPRTRHDLNQFVQSLTVTLLSLIAVAVAAGYLTRRMGRIPLLKNILLQPPGADDEIIAVNPNAPITESLVGGKWVRVGERGRAESPLRPAGRVRLGDHFVDVVSDGVFIESGELIEVIDVRANRIVVRRVE